MEGRAAGSPGALRAQHYLEQQLQAIGLVPMGEHGTYEQALQTVRRRVGESSLAVGTTAFTLWKDFVPLPWPWKTRPFTEAQAVYAGTIGDSIGFDVRGKFVILSQPGARTVIPRIGPGDPLSQAAAVALVGLESFSAARLAPIRAGLSAGLAGNAMLREVVPASLLITTAAAESLLGKPFTQLTPGDVGRGVRASITLSDSLEPICCNLVAALRGSDRARAGEYVALSAHLDHIGVAPEPVHGDSIFNGADDDGSGTVALLEIARRLRAQRRAPRRSTLFVWHTAEELGNQGSTWFTNHPTVPLDSIVALLHLDMVGRNDPRTLEVIGSRRRSRALGDLITQTNAQRRTPFALDYSHDSPTDSMHLYCRSDHYEYARYGIPIAFFTTGEHADYHQVTDEAERIDYQKLAAVVRLVRDVTVRLADQVARPAPDSAAPDPARGCGG